MTRTDLFGQIADAIAEYGTAQYVAGQRGALGSASRDEAGKAVGQTFRDLIRAVEQLRDEPTATAPTTPRRRGLPTFAEMRINALRMLGDARDELASDWREGTGPTRQQATALRGAREAIARAKTALDRAAQH